MEQSSELFGVDAPERKIDMKEFQVEKLADGFGYGDGSISTTDRPELKVETIQAATEVIVNDPNLLVDVDKDKDGKMLDDDGCGDGRGVRKIWQGVKEKLRSLHRPKVFGAAVAMSTAAHIGMGDAKGQTVKDAFLNGGLTRLKRQMIGFGAHTDTHAHGPFCGCGAIDKAPQIIGMAVKYQVKIRESIFSVLPRSAQVDQDLDEIFSNYSDFAEANKDDDTFAGADVSDAIVGNGKVVKELEGDHKEWFVILNTVFGKTVDQDLIRQASDGELQAFAVDVWRMQDLAERFYPNDPVKQQKAFLSELVYTMAVSATLTKGDLPVYVTSAVTATQAA